MKKDLFTALLESVRQGGAIVRGEMPPSRSFEFAAPDVVRDGVDPPADARAPSRGGVRVHGPSI